LDRGVVGVRREVVNRRHEAVFEPLDHRAEAPPPGARRPRGCLDVALADRPPPILETHDRYLFLQGRVEKVMVGEVACLPARPPPARSRARALPFPLRWRGILDGGWFGPTRQPWLAAGATDRPADDHQT